MTREEIVPRARYVKTRTGGKPVLIPPLNAIYQNEKEVQSGLAVKDGSPT
jgi:hypothetical protein